MERTADDRQGNPPPLLAASGLLGLGANGTPLVIRGSCCENEGCSCDTVHWGLRGVTPKGDSTEVPAAVPLPCRIAGCGEPCRVMNVRAKLHSYSRCCCRS